MEQVAGQHALRPFLSAAGFVNVGALGFVAAQQALFRHDLHGLQDRGVLGGLAFGDDFVDVANGSRSARPQYRQNIELGVGG